MFDEFVQAMSREASPNGAESVAQLCRSTLHIKGTLMQDDCVQ